MTFHSYLPLPSAPTTNPTSRDVVTSGALATALSSSGQTREAPPTREISAEEWRAIVHTTAKAGVSGVSCTRQLARDYGREDRHTSSNPEIDDLVAIGIRLGDMGLGQTYTTAGPISQTSEVVRRLAVAIESHGPMILQMRGAEERSIFVLVKNVVSDATNPDEAVLHIQDPSAPENLLSIRASLVAPSISYSDGQHIAGVHAYLDTVTDRAQRVDAAAGVFRSAHPLLSRFPGVLALVRFAAFLEERRDNPWPGE